MHDYDFISKNITLAQVKSIISEAGYKPENYRYQPRVDKDGYLVQGNDVMSVTTLRNAAKALKITVEIYLGYVAELTAVGDGTDYQVDIIMDVETVQKLLKGNFFLYGFKAVQSSQGNGAPLVWFSTQSFSTDTNVNWTKQYQAYTSTSEIIANGRIKASFSTNITLGQILDVEIGGVGEVVNGGTSSAISINNTTTTEYTCGISEMQDGVSKPLCAFPLYGLNEDVIVPIEKVLLMFSTKPVNTGTVIESSIQQSLTNLDSTDSYSSGILLDLTGNGNNERSLSYNINTG